MDLQNKDVNKDLVTKLLKTVRKSLEKLKTEPKFLI